MENPNSLPPLFDPEVIPHEAAERLFNKLLINYMSTEDYTTGTNVERERVQLLHLQTSATQYFQAYKKVEI